MPLILKNKIKNYIKKDWLFYAGSCLLFIIINLILFHDSHKVGYFFGDYNFFKDYQANFLNPLTGDRWQPMIYIANYLAVQVFHFQPFWPKLIVFTFYNINFILAFWLLNILTKNKLISFLSSLLFVLYFRGTALVFSYADGPYDAVFPTLFLFSLISYYYYLRLRKIYLFLIPLILFPAALMIKESMIILPAILFLMDLFFNQSFRLKTAIKGMLPFFLIFVIYGFTLILTAVPNPKNLMPGSLIERGDYYFMPLKMIIEKFYRLIVGHFPAFWDEATHSQYIYLIVISIAILISLALLILNIPKIIKFFLCSFWLLIIPYGLFGNSGFVADRYVYLSGLFFIAIIVYGLWFLLNDNKLKIITFGTLITIFAILNFRLLILRIYQWQEGWQVVSTVTEEFKQKYPQLPSSPLYIIGLPRKIDSWGNVSLGYQGNFIYYLYNQTWPDYLLVVSDTDEAMKDYNDLLSCSDNKKPNAIIYTNGHLENFDLLGVINDEKEKSNTPNCSSPD